METLASPNPPWPDLPDPLLELILERLPLSAYVRFSSVCRRWRSVQSSHRRRHSPSPPPMLRIPWLVLYLPLNQETISFYSLFEDKFFEIPLPFSRYLDSFSCGWLLMSSDDSCKNLNLFNPISGARIDLPDMHVVHCSVASSSPPNYVVCVTGVSSIFLLRWFDSGWVKLNPPPGVELRRMVSCGGKHYFLCMVGDLLAVDPLATPATSQYFEMTGLSEMAMIEIGWRRHGDTHFVAFDEEPLLVMEVVENETSCGRITVGFEVFRADLRRKMWVRVESIGDRVLMLHGLQSVSLLAGDIGARGNCIYFSAGFRIEEECAEAEAPWKVFDLGTGGVTDLWLPNASHIENGAQELFMPSLC